MTLSLNTSALYLGAAAGSTLGGFAIGRWSIGAIGWVAALCDAAAFGWLLLTIARRRAPRTRRSGEREAIAR